MNSVSREAASFGPFRLFPSARALEKNGVPVALGNRALDILIVLVERAGQIVSHRDLITRVWRDLVVDQGNLRVHITGLRKALGDGQGDARYIANVSGQGYCFVAPVAFARSIDGPAQQAKYPCASARQSLTLPPVLGRMIGRAESIRTVTSDILTDRFVTVVGPGGIGKTTVAVAVAHTMLEEFADAVCFVDTSTVKDSKLVAATVASTLGLTIQTDNVLPVLMECLKSLRILLVLDNCEHAIDATAALAERIFNETEGVHILATSRETLRVEGERAYALPPLKCPPVDAAVSAEEMQSFPAFELFMERAAASGSRIELNEHEAPIVADLCRRLDGVPLAIELAAGRVGTHGIAGTARLLSGRFGLHWEGRRTALPRHRTLQALLDWSHDLLAERERVVFRRISIFVGKFTAEAAAAVAADDTLGDIEVVDTLYVLVAKSLVSAVASHDGITRFRLLETTRAYALERLDESGEMPQVADRHATYFARALEGGAGKVGETFRRGRVLSSAENLGSIRAALEWCFAADDRADAAAARLPDPDAAIARQVRASLGIELAAAAAPPFLELSLLNECSRWSSTALSHLDESTRDTVREMVLQEARAISSSWAHGNADNVFGAITRGLELAERLDEDACRVRLLVGLHIFMLRFGDFRRSIEVVDAFDAATQSSKDATHAVLSHWMRASSQHFTVDQAAALQTFERGFALHGVRNIQLFGLDYRVRAMVTFARVLWLSGFPDRAANLAREAIDEAAGMSKPLNVCFSLLYTAPVFLWCGDYDAAREVLDKLVAHPNWRALPSLHATERSLRGELLLRLGETERGASLVAFALRSMQDERQNILAARTAYVMAQSLASVGKSEEALSTVREAIARVESGGEALELAELLRIEATILLSMPEPDAPAAQARLAQSLACARKQRAPAWELRSAITMAQFLAQQQHREDARKLLADVYSQFTEGFATRDLQAASSMLAELEASASSRPPSGAHD